MRTRTGARSREDRPLDEVVVSYVFDDLALTPGSQRALFGAAFGKPLVWRRDRWEPARAGRPVASTRARRSAASAMRSATPAARSSRSRATSPRTSSRRTSRRRAARARSVALRLLARALPLVPRSATELLAPYAAPTTDYARTRFAVVAQVRRGFSAAQLVVRGRDLYRTDRGDRRVDRAAARHAHAQARPACVRPRSCSVPSPRCASSRRSRADDRTELGTSFGDTRSAADAWYQRSMSMSWQLEAEAPAGRGATARRYRLSNGLALIAALDRRAPIVALQTWFRVGSRHERPGTTGMAHLFEHLMFGQTESLPPGEFDRLVERTGGESNAATWVDWTYYRLSLPARDLALGVRLEAERMQHLVLEPRPSSPSATSSPTSAASASRTTSTAGSTSS